MQRKRKLFDASSFAVYYGHGMAEQLCSFDIAVVEPDGQSQSSIQRLRKSGTLAIAYLSVMEIHPYSPEFGLLNEKDFLTIYGKPRINENFGSYILDLSSQKWINLLNHKLGRLFYHYGFDGVFLDTIGDVEMHHIPPIVQSRLISAAVSFLKQTRRYFPDRIIIQNNGLEQLCLHTAPLIDGLCWENPPFEREECLTWMNNVLHRIENLSEEHGIRVMLLSEEFGSGSTPSSGLDAAKRVAKINNYLMYVGGVNPPVRLRCPGVPNVRL